MDAYHCLLEMTLMEYKHPWIPITKDTEKEMLVSIGKKSLEDLFCNIPEKFRVNYDLNLPNSHSEFEVSERIQELAGKNKPASDGSVFLGAGVGMHYIPAIVPALAGRSEFVTSYTSYQAEISQGMLQTLFEYQSLLAEILQIDVVNSSMYDMSTGVGEAARMTVRVKKKRSKFLVPGTINPEHYNVLHTYTEPVDIEVVKIDYDRTTGLMSLSDLKSKMDDLVAGVYIESPTHLGFIETQVDEIAQIVHENDSLLVAGVDILSLGILRPPGDYAADIIVAEGQHLGSPVSYGGPLLGIFGCTNDRKLIYQLPGRLVGLTRTEEEPYEDGYMLTLSPREQHIRREKATSNICSNQALAAVTAAIYMSVLGPSGIEQIGETIALKANYAAKQLNAITGVKAPAIGSAIWKEFVVQFENGITAAQVHEGLLHHGLQGGKILNSDFPDLGESMLFCVTEIHTQPAIDKLVPTVEDIVRNGGATK
ncbi:MAG: aminomethyl-transferring glycine dehydrogenase subunit GcvPA [Candidatus Thorarchaeota archaeon]|nr:MAG: aminomethyl-transferring glycine dehydrogenase subunit GcvPA [Candidatus Thorarchaeota archaeon]